ncbi:DUF945 family protein [Halomonas llamarensis]|uniref:YdgA family protein n=1 Tax=Halomonas llamarensis TaxID=2945104 RepID=A0ABT0STU7_9GAMM|nr:DUF945 family protein [Halomonas llamarensis]MCL7931253.1 YdgA family protein [Halomonas llamarensis]
MRKERLIVPAIAVVVVIWMAAQLLSSVLFERSMHQALEDLKARGEWRVQRTENDPGWLTSHGKVILSPLLGRPWRLEVSYRARHGILNTDIEGTLMPRLDTVLQRAVGDVSVPSAPRWQGRYQTLSGHTELRLALAPLVIEQDGRYLEVRGARVRLEGVFGDWRLRGLFNELVIKDRDARLVLGPSVLESRYTYTQDAYHFNQHDRLHIESLSLTHPDLNLTVTPLELNSDMVLDEQELRIASELVVGDAILTDEAPQAPILRGRIEAELSRIDADAVREVIVQLRQEAARGSVEMPVEEGLLARLEPNLLQTLKASPRLDIHAIDMESPLLGIDIDANGALFFDPRRLEALSLIDATHEPMPSHWRSRFEGDITWQNAPPVAALWLGLPLSTRSLTFDLIQGNWRVNGRPLPNF